MKLLIKEFNAEMSQCPPNFRAAAYVHEIYESMTKPTSAQGC